MYKLYYYPGNASLAPHLALEKMGVPFELELVDRKIDSQKSPEYLMLNPAGRIPTLVNDDLVIFESSAICLYLCEQHPESNLIPPMGTHARAHFYQWLMYLNNTVQTEMLMYHYPFKHTIEIENATSIQRAQEGRLTNMFKILDNTLSKSQYLVGDSVTICDYFLLMVAMWGRNLTLPPLKYPRLGRYLGRLIEDETVMKVFEKEDISLT